MFLTSGKYTLEKAEGAIKNGQSRDTGNIGGTRRRAKTKQVTKSQHDTENISYQMRSVCVNVIQYYYILFIQPVYIKT
jgi:hypothetical protein